MNLSIPFNIGGHARAGDNAAAARYQAARHEHLAQGRQVLAQLSTVLRAQRRAHQHLIQHDKRIPVISRRLAEQAARMSLADDDALILSLVAERELQEAKLERIVAWHDLWLQQASLQLFTDDNDQEAHLLGSRWLTWQSGAVQAAASQSRGVAAQRQTRAPVSWNSGAYVWDSHALLDSSLQSAELAALQKAGITRVYLGLDAGQVAAPQASRKALAGLLHQARSQGMSISLLLGEPLWILPRHRSDLINLVRDFQDLPFDALHLDLEVEQLGWPVPPSRVRDWLDTLAEVSQASPWPVELSSHHRWFQAPDDQFPCVPCTLPELGVKGVSLMIYTRNVERSTKLAQEAASRWPGLNFRLAQSMEPELNDQESWARAQQAQVQAALNTWRATLQAVGLSGVDWQGWADLRRYIDKTSKHESQIQ